METSVNTVLYITQLCHNFCKQVFNGHHTGFVVRFSIFDNLSKSFFFNFGFLAGLWHGYPDSRRLAFHWHLSFANFVDK